MREIRLLLLTYLVVMQMLFPSVIRIVLLADTGKHSLLCYYNVIAGVVCIMAPREVLSLSITSTGWAVYTGTLKKSRLTASNNQPMEVREKKTSRVATNPATPALTSFNSGCPPLYATCGLAWTKMLAKDSISMVYHTFHTSLNIYLFYTDCPK